jgi:3-methyl-2-oxobutanoate hydroxymethyltransferase
VEAEVIPGPVLAEISRRSALITVSLGSGACADVMYLFLQDICGDEDDPPRHARAYANLAALRRQIRDERIRALTAFREDAMNERFPGKQETVGMEPSEIEGFMERLEHGH